MTLKPPPTADTYAPKRTVLPILEARTLTKQYRMPGETVDAVRGVTLAVMPGADHVATFNRAEDALAIVLPFIAAQESGVRR